MALWEASGGGIGCFSAAGRDESSLRLDDVTPECVFSDDMGFDVSGIEG